MLSLCFLQLEIVKLLVESGANVNHRDHLGVTALFWATGDILSCCAFCKKIFVMNWCRLLCYCCSHFLLIVLPLTNVFVIN